MKQLLHDFLAGFPDFSREEVDAIVKSSSVQMHKKGTLLLREGQTCKQCFFVLQGCVRQYELVDGEEKTTAFYTEGQAAISYESYMEGRPSKVYLSCVEDTVLTSGTKEEERQLHLRFPQLKFLTHTLLTREYSRIKTQLVDTVHQSPEDRYKQLIATAPHLIHRVPLHQLASYIGVTPESFSRIRKRIIEKEKQSDL